MCVCRGTADGFVARILWGFCESFAALAPITKDYPLKLVGGKDDFGVARESHASTV